MPYNHTSSSDVSPGYHLAHETLDSFNDLHPAQHADFVKTRDPFTHFCQGVISQAAKLRGTNDSPQLVFRRATLNGGRNVAVRDDRFEDSNPIEIAGLLTGRATSGLEHLFWRFQFVSLKDRPLLRGD